MDTLTAPPPVAESAPQSRTPTSGRTLILVTVLLAVAMMLVFPVRSWFTQRAVLAELEGEITAAQQRVDDLQRQRDTWQDPNHIEAEARRRLNMVRKGENALIVMRPQEQSAAEVPPPADTWYGRLWQSVEERSGRRPADLAETATDPGSPR
ncbi:MAG: septum formation initiator family protein [Actinobacteria bacterium]|nr:septum formation initiator family protein [Actinomycetota bacterium]